ncbi:MAG: NAD(P)-dependent oxidoreductase [Candidatus Andeanibacterium colombiense]|uniref:NAD(P)-dependent oxidoreductase n=1 Tax=Candidatus Andeanibacterium colombiense TaxID=3121345 RepID=A0AAJ6BNI4_9SPHN|nr:MAG: NAD(P)-dependent oxidoreductase [Sphingomonadaceae bacterium]
MTTIGFIGLGRMGANMSARLLDHADELIVHDLSAEAVQSLADQGAATAGSAKELGDRCDIVFVSLPTPPIVRGAVLGATGIAQGGRVKIVCDLSTSGPKLAIDLAEALATKGIASIDAPVSGGIKGAKDGTLAIMASGPQAAYDTVEPLIARMGRVFYMGETPGAGQTMKLVNNLLGAVAIAVTSEGMAMGIKAGLDPAKMIDVLNSGTGINSATRDKWPRAVLPRTFDFGFAAALSLKDTKLLLDEAEGMGVPLPLGEIVRDYLETALADYGPDADFTAMAKVAEKNAGLDPERSA